MTLWGILGDGNMDLPQDFTDEIAKNNGFVRKILNCSFIPENEIWICHTFLRTKCSKTTVSSVNIIIAAVFREIEYGSGTSIYGRNAQKS
jgi:hypothetical protein